MPLANYPWIIEPSTIITIGLYHPFSLARKAKNNLTHVQALYVTPLYHFVILYIICFVC
jgi:hypothetical protein